MLDLLYFICSKVHTLPLLVQTTPWTREGELTLMRQNTTLGAAESQERV